MFGKARVRGIIIALLALGLAAPAAADTLKFKFKEPSDANGWTAVTQKWKVKDKGYRPFLQEATLLYPIAVLDKPLFETVEATFEINDLGAGNFAGGLVRSKVDGITIDGYLTLLYNNDNVTGQIILYKLNDFSADETSGEALPLCVEAINIEQSKLLTVSAKGSKLKVFYNGSLICSVSDASYKKGRIGLFTNYAPGESPAYKSVTLID
jgi:hypothetical protein